MNTVAKWRRYRRAGSGLLPLALAGNIASIETTCGERRISLHLKIPLDGGIRVANLVSLGGRGDRRLCGGGWRSNVLRLGGNGLRCGLDTRGKGRALIGGGSGERNGNCRRGEGAHNADLHGRARSLRVASCPLCRLEGPHLCPSGCAMLRHVECPSALPMFGGRASVSRASSCGGGSSAFQATTNVGPRRAPTVPPGRVIAEFLPSASLPSRFRRAKPLHST